MYHFTNEKRVIKLPSLAYNLLKGEIWESMGEYLITPDEQNLQGNRFEFMGVIYEKETSDNTYKSQSKPYTNGDN